MVVVVVVVVVAVVVEVVIVVAEQERRENFTLKRAVPIVLLCEVKKHKLLANKMIREL